MKPPDARTVWVYRLDPRSAALNAVPISVPSGSTLLHVERQYGYIAAWFDISALAGASDLRYFQVFGTGHPIPDDARYCGTTLFQDGELVLHLYEVTL